MLLGTRASGSHQHSVDERDTHGPPHCACPTTCRRESVGLATPNGERRPGRNLRCMAEASDAVVVACAGGAAANSAASRIWVDFGPSLVRPLARFRRNGSRYWLNIDQVRAEVARIRPILPDVGKLWSHVEFGPTSAESNFGFGPNSTIWGQFWSSSVRFGPYLVEVGPNSVDIDQTRLKSTKLGRPACFLFGGGVSLAVSGRHRHLRSIAGADSGVGAGGTDAPGGFRRTLGSGLPGVADPGCVWGRRAGAVAAGEQVLDRNRVAPEFVGLRIFEAVVRRVETLGVKLQEPYFGRSLKRETQVFCRTPC